MLAGSERISGYERSARMVPAAEERWFGDRALGVGTFARRTVTQASVPPPERARSSRFRSEVLDEPPGHEQADAQPCGARKPRFAFLPATIRPRWSLPVGQSLHSRTGCICEGRSEESVGPLLGELARVSEDDLNLGIPDLQACQHIGEPGTGNML